MKTYFGTQNLDSSFPSRTVVAIGNFDGIHLGHQAILKRAREHADRLQVPVVCLTFNPHPTMELRPESNLKLLMTYEEKRNLLSSYQVDFCVEALFNSEFAKTTAQDFFEKIIKGSLHAVGVVVGDNFSFGRNREGSMDRLAEFCQSTGMFLEAMSPVEWNGLPVSSSRIRQALAQGEVVEACAMLGRPFFYRAEVVHGDKRGRTIGFPTANMKCEEKFPLKVGVYATSVVWRDREFQSVTNIGTRPTFDSIGIKVETHILDQDFELYGEFLEVKFHERIRDEQKFASIDALKNQIQSDTQLARQLLSARNF
jgi:riboflavin kinase/FMN adenylyltransferase